MSNLLKKQWSVVSGQSSGKAFYAVFILINLLLTCYFVDVWITPNAGSRAVPVLTMYEDKSLVIDKYKDYAGDFSVINNHYYSNKAPLSSFIVYPFYYLYKSLGLPELKDTTLKKYPILIYAYTNPDGSVLMADGRGFLLPKSSTVLIIGDILCSSIPFVLALLLSLMAIKRTSGSFSPVVIVMLSFYATFLFAYSGTFTGHLLSGIFVLGGYIFIKEKKYLPSGLMVGLATATEFPVGILIPLWAILIYFNEKKISKSMLFAAGLLPGLLILMWYDYHLTGSITKTPYSYEIHQFKEQSGDIGFYFPKLSSLWGLTFSSFRGVVFYTPVLIIILLYLIKSFIVQPQTPKGALKSNVSAQSPFRGFGLSFYKNYLLITIITYLVLYSSYYMWPGGWAFGPRYLIPMVMIVLYEGVIFLSSNRFSLLAGKTGKYLFYAITGIGLLLVWMDKSTKIYMLPDDSTRFSNPIFDVVIPDFMQHKFNSNLLPVFAFDTSPIFAVYLWLLLFLAGIIGLAIWYNKLHPVKQDKGQTQRTAPTRITPQKIKGKPRTN